MMFLRRTVVGLLVAASVVAVILLQSSRPTLRAEATFSRLGKPTMPFVPKGQFVTSAWFCAGVPVGKAQTGGSVVIANPSEVALAGKVSVFTDASGVAAVSSAFDVPARDKLLIDVKKMQSQGTFVSAMVEIYGGGGYVEQSADSAAGSAVSPCSNSTSSSWYLADGYTLDGSSEKIVITNPFPSDAIVQIVEATKTESRPPASLKSLEVKAQSVLVIDQSLLAKQEAVLALTVTTKRGRVVVGRAEEYTSTGDRAGFTMSLAAPSLGDQFFFADGEVGPNVLSETYSIYNGSDGEVVVTPVFLGLGAEASGVTDPITIPAGRVASLSTADVQGLPAGRHGAVFSTDTPESIIVERAITRKTAETVATTVVMGAPPSFLSPRWSMAIGTDLTVRDILVVLNSTAAAGTVTVKTLGAGGEVAVPQMENIELPPGAVITIGISDDTAKGHPLVVESTQPIIVERLLPRDPSLRGRSGSFALPG
jgi:Family of unknown function (DUF5719)